MNPNRIVIISLVVLVVFGVYGWLLPFLLSASSTPLFIAGLLLVVLTVVGLAYLLYSVVDQVPTEDKPKEEEHSDT